MRRSAAPAATPRPPDTTGGASPWRRGARRGPNTTTAPPSRVLALAPRHPEATNNLAASLLALGDAEGALPLFERALTLAPDDPDSYRIFANVLVQSGQEERAAAVLEKCLATLPAPQPELEAQLAGLRSSGPPP